MKRSPDLFYRGMMTVQSHEIQIDDIYIPAPRRKTLKPEKVDELAEDILENGMQRAIQVRQGKGRYVLVEGYHRLEACKLLGETKIAAYLVQAKKF